MSDNQPTMLLTGASGVMGRALIEEFAPDFDLVGLRHRSMIDDPRVREVRGDLSHPDLGIAPGELRALARDVDVVVHAGASTDWRAKSDDVVTTNVGGTRSVLGFVERSGAPLYHISTAFVIRHRERDPGEEPSGPVAYVESKVAAEDAVRASGLPAVLVRPSIVVGDSRTGQIQAFQGIHKVMSSILKNALPVLPAEPRSLIDCIPQDVAARATGRLVRTGVTGGEYWLTAGDQALTLQEMVETTLSVADQLTLDVHRPRMIPTEAVDRLLLPLMEDVIPPALRRQFRGFNQLMMLFQNQATIPCSLPEIGLDVTLTHTALLAAFRRGLEHLAVRQGLATPDAFASGEAVA